MGGLFSRKQKPDKPAKAAINEKDKAIYDLKIQRDRLRKFQTQNDLLIKKETAAARELLRNGQKERAKLILRKKKYHETLIEGTYGKLASIEELVNSIRFAEMQAEVFSALKEGNEALKEINSQISIEDVEKLMDESAEAIAYQDELNELLSTELSPEDDLAALAELEAIEEEEAQALNLPAAPVQAEPAEQEHVQVEEEEESEKEGEEVQARTEEPVLA